MSLLKEAMRLPVKGIQKEVEDVVNVPDKSDLGLLAVRLIVGGLMAGHGAQKLFGWFGGHGLQGTGGFMETLGLQPGKRWAGLAGAGEFGAGVLTAIGLFHPVGELLMLGPMAVATGKVHWGKEIWTSQGGAEVPVLYSAAAVGLALAGPGRLSFDRLLGIKVPGILVALTVAGLGVGTVVALRHRPTQTAASGSSEGEGQGTVEIEIVEIDAPAA